MICNSHSLIGYDRVNERVAEELDVPDAVLPRAKKLAGVPVDDPDALMCYPLDPLTAHELAGSFEARVDTGRNDYFLEGVAEEA